MNPETYGFMQRKLQDPDFARGMLETAHTVGIIITGNWQKLSDDAVVSLAQQVLDLAAATQLRREGMLH